MGGNKCREGHALLLPGVTSGSPDVSGGSECESVTHRWLARASTAGNFSFGLLTLSFKGSVMFYAKDTWAMIKNSHLPWKQPIANFKNHSYFSVLPLFRVQLCKWSAASAAGGWRHLTDRRGHRELLQQVFTCALLCLVITCWGHAVCVTCRCRGCLHGKENIRHWLASRLRYLPSWKRPIFKLMRVAELEEPRNATGSLIQKAPIFWWCSDILSDPKDLFTLFH